MTAPPRYRTPPMLGSKSGRWQGKSTGAWIARQLPMRDSYIEPFCGMAGVLLNRQQANTEILNDLDGNFGNWWAAIRDRGDDFLRLVEASPHSEADFRAAARLLDEPFRYDPDAPADLRRAAAFYRRLTFSQRHSTGRRPHFAVTWKGKVLPPERVPDIAHLADRLRGVQLLCRDALEILERTAREEGIVVYADPPYGGLKDYAATVDRDDLRRALLAQRGACAVSGFDSDWDDLGWRREERSRLFTGFGKDGGEQSNRTERLWLNFPPVRTALFEEANYD